MKLAAGIAVFVWLLCGLAGDWMIEDGEDLRWKKVIRGPITLIQALKEEDPVKYPGT